MTNHISIFAVTAHNADDWFSLTLDEVDARARLLADTKGRSGILRFVLKRGPSLLGRFALEVRDAGATTWLPRLAQEVIPLLLSRMVEHIVIVCRESGVRFAECTLISESVESRKWETALLAHGFKLTAVRCEWARTSAWPSFDPPPQCRIVEISANHDQVADLYMHSLKSSLDRTTLLEAAHGETLGAADRIFVALADGAYVGLCACLHNAEADYAWIKYVGLVPNYRRMGIGAALVRIAGATTAAAGAETTRSLIDVGNEPSINLHKAAGFERTKTCGRSYYLVL
jgi:mycothiol synthase